MMQSPDSNDSQSRSDAEECNGENGTCTVRRLLFIDDDKAILDGYKFIFEGEGFIVDIATDAKSALELVEKNSYSVIVMDYLLPEMKGIDLAEQIQAINSSINLVLISGQKDVEEEINKKGIKISGVFLKPLKIETLIDFVLEIINTD